MSLTKDYWRAYFFLTYLLAMKELTKSTNRRLSGFLTNQAAKHDLRTILPTGLKKDMVLTGYLEKQVLENRH